MAEPLTDFRGLEAALSRLPQPDPDCIAAAQARQALLTKPAGSLGRLEEIAVWLAGWQARHPAGVERVQAVVFAGNHGVAVRGVSAFPAEVTAQMVANFEHGGAAINQLCTAAGATLSVHALSLDRPTEDFTQGPAMSEEACITAVADGMRALDPEADLVCVGEMGIGNTTTAAALSCALFGGAPEDWVGRGTGVDDAGLRRKARVVGEAVTRHAALRGRPLALMAALGGRELAAIAGTVLAARLARVPVLLDGFVTCAAVAPLRVAEAGALDHCLAAHRSAEAAHGRLLEALALAPLLDLGMRLGEASGAATAVPILRAAAACHAGMATFAEAGVSDG